MSTVFVYAPTPSGRRLAEALDASRLRQFDQMDFWSKGTRVTLPADAVIVNWARLQLDLDGPRLLNGGSYYTESSGRILRHLYNSGIRTLPTSWQRGAKPTGGNHDLHRWLARRWNDAFHPIDQPRSGRYWTRWMPLSREFRLHMFNGRCIKSGEKVPQLGLTVAKTEEAWASPSSSAAHPWWRSTRGGWTVDYDAFKSSDELRKIAKRAVMCLGLHFASVDIGLDHEGHYFVLDVNPTPVLTDSLLLVYTRVIKKWIENSKVDGEEDVPPLPPREADAYYPPPLPEPIRTRPAPAPGSTAGRAYARMDVARQDRAVLRGREALQAVGLLDPDPFVLEDELDDPDEPDEPPVIQPPPPPAPDHLGRWIAANGVILRGENA